MRKHRKPATVKHPARALPAFDDDPAQDDPHDAIEQELLGIWLSVSRLHEIIRGMPAPGSRVVPLQRQAAPGNAAPKKPVPKKPRRKAA